MDPRSDKTVPRKIYAVFNMSSREGSISVQRSSLCVRARERACERVSGYLPVKGRGLLRNQTETFQRRRNWWNIFKIRHRQSRLINKMFQC